jgi:hypothetical protein
MVERVSENSTVNTYSLNDRIDTAIPPALGVEILTFHGIGHKPYVNDNGQWQVIWEKRSSTLFNHSGLTQVHQTSGELFL